MDTPICDFVRRYAQADPLRLHMPGHKGVGSLGCEQLDITEVAGADSLYEAEGIIAQSERNASALFGCPTFYSTEGSSLCIRAMLYLAVLHAKQQGKRPRIAAVRNVHKSFLSAAALLDPDVLWLYPEHQENYLSCEPDADRIDRLLEGQAVTAVYLTSPDYLGNVADIAAISTVCRKHGALLLVDNAHGAYLKFLEPSRHPVDLGADLCCDSAHKTLPVLTGGGYLHVAAHTGLQAYAKNALELFGSTSPSYLILQSLDAANRILAEGWEIAECVQKAQLLGQKLTAAGYRLISREPLKLTISAKPYGYTGEALAQLLRRKGLECEFADPDFLVLMLTPEVTGPEQLARLEQALLGIPRQAPIQEPIPAFMPGEQVLSIREAALSPRETVPLEASLGRILAAANVSCPPAVPILIPGQRIDTNAIDSFRYYGLLSCAVVK